ncbi:fimbrial protein [Pseudomonas sp. P1B16]|jgi:P pilus assembly protein, pilin FimA|uniref:fimbrial protein n=1 Tax=unclassified Pseudomonas TaxID=196821 RepID=UPI000F954F37|nr:MULTISPECIES: fimbrial protein [unclassified Pseudomonas]UDU80076.1 type 1 fimbrial protein [Pseudomonas sp. HN2-3]UPL07255.1 PAP fimbrial minor pilin protein precursor [Pseudomonas sp. IsoF]WPM25431.1 fimbrial protein [Pseudomonas sp. P1B16]
MNHTTALWLIPLALLFVLSEPASATEPLPGGSFKGRVQIAGSIVDSACSIRVGGDSQTIAFKPLALNGLLSGDTTSQQSLTIYISDCITPEKHNKKTDPFQRFTLTFEGQPYGKNFGIQGGAKGIALQIKDNQGKLVSPGMLLEHGALSIDSLMLNYSMTLIGSGHTLEAGDYHATIKLSIQHF